MMIRKFRMLGVLMAVVAMSAVTASAAQAQFTSAAYPATVTGTSTGDVFDMFGSSVKCTNNSFSGSLNAASSTLTITPTYQNCTAFGLPMTINLTGCDYLFHTGASKTVDIACKNAGEAIDITVYSAANHATALCHVQIPAQTGKGGFELTNSGGKVVISGSIGSVTATQTRTSAVLCPPGTHTGTGTYTIQAGGIAMSGSNGAISVD